MGMAYSLAQGRGLVNKRAGAKTLLPQEYREKKAEIKMPVRFFSEKKGWARASLGALLYG
jgi:hypothetical protein